MSAFTPFPEQVSQKQNDVFSSVNMGVFAFHVDSLVVTWDVDTNGHANLFVNGNLEESEIVGEGGKTVWLSEPLISPDITYETKVGFELDTYNVNFSATNRTFDFTLGFRPIL